MPKHAGSGIAGKHKEKCNRYAAQNRRHVNKLKRVRKSNGEIAAKAYERVGHAKRYTERH